MVSREDFVTLVFVVAALPVAYGVETVTGEFSLGFLALLTVGVFIPMTINECEKTRRNNA